MVFGVVIYSVKCVFCNIVNVIVDDVIVKLIFFFVSCSGSRWNNTYLYEFASSGNFFNFFKFVGGFLVDIMGVMEFVLIVIVMKNIV